MVTVDSNRNGKIEIQLFQLVFNQKHSLTNLQSVKTLLKARHSRLSSFTMKTICVDARFGKVFNETVHAKIAIRVLKRLPAEGIVREDTS